MSKADKRSKLELRLEEALNEIETLKSKIKELDEELSNAWQNNIELERINTENANYIYKLERQINDDPTMF